MPDDNGFVRVRMNENSVASSAPLEIVVVENWFEGLKARIPPE